MKKRKKGFIAGDYLGWLIAGLAILVLGLVAYFIFSGKASGLLEHIKNIFRLRRG